jgi:gamma-glutamyl hercynylcysteine S-oxide synthase
MKAISPRITVFSPILGVLIASLSFGAIIFIFGSRLGTSAIVGGAAIGMVYILWRVRLNSRMYDAREKSRIIRTLPEKEAMHDRSPVISPLPTSRKAVDPNDINALVEQMSEQGRFALLLRQQVAGNLSEEQFGQALGVLGECMALVPDGDVQLEEGDSSRVVRVQRFFLDRYPVTNRQYYEFVMAGGYHQPGLWDEAILPGVLEFVDRTGDPGPKYWQNGRYPEGEDKHPIVGVSWYEAAAYARWVGKRLPSDAEWIKAGAWPVRISSTTQVQRKYPWGDSMERSRANLWGSGPGRTVPVDQYPGGVSAGGVYQLIGNVWEWTTSNFSGASLPSEHLPTQGLRLSTPLRSIRGGAFDTYFDNQAAFQFQSGENPLSRRDNIGFRCVVGVCDLMLVRAERKEHQESAATVCVK